MSKQARLRFSGLLTRLVYRDARKKLSLGIGLLVMIQVWLIRYVPPWVIRDSIQDAAPHARSIFLLITLFVYSLVTSSLFSILIGSRRLQFFYHLPLSTRAWSWIHIKHALLLNIPWFGLMGYALLTGDKGYPLPMGLLPWGAGCALTLALQFLWYQQPPWRRALQTSPKGLTEWLQQPLVRLLYWVMPPCLLYPLFRHPTWWGYTIILVLASRLTYSFSQLRPPQTNPRQRTLFELRWPSSLAWFRVELLTLLRRCKQPILSRWMGQIVLALCFALAIANNGLKGDALLLHISIGMMPYMALCGGSIVTMVQTHRQPYQWWDEHIGLRTLDLAYARWGIGMLGSCTPPLWMALAASFVGSPFTMWGLLKLFLSGLIIAVWSSTVVSYLGWRGQQYGSLDDGIGWFIIGHGLLPTILLAYFPWLIFALPLQAIYYAVRGYRHLEKTRTKQRFIPPPRGLTLDHY